MATSHSAAAGPYARLAFTYRAEGWLGVLPLPVRAKTPPPGGFTGGHDIWPSGADIHEWTEHNGAGNIALRLPDDVIGVDVDAYGAKVGAATLAAACERFGPLPATWRSTSRDDGVSGIYLFRVPTGRAWPSILGSNVEIIRTAHRYAVVHPSVHPDSGATYRWVSPVGLTAVAGGVPAPDDLPDLPASWVRGLEQGAALPAPERVPLSAELIDTRLDNGPMCRVMAKVCGDSAASVVSVGSRHDGGLRVIMHLTRLRSEGHTGLRSALDVLWSVWHGAVTAVGGGQRTDVVAEREWLSMVGGALALTSRPEAVDPCVDELASILGPDWANDVSAPVGTAMGVTVDSAQSADTEADSRRASWRMQLVAVEAEKLRIRREAQTLVTAERQPPWRQPPGGTLADLLAQPREALAFAVADVMPEGANVLLAAQYKSGKTTLVNHLSGCLVDGIDFLGRYAVKNPGPVALWNYEVNEAQYIDWLSRLGILNTSAVHVLSLRGYPMPLVLDSIAEWTVGWLSTRGVQTWIVDPFARAFIGSGENENSNSEVGIFLDLLDRIKERAGVKNLVMPTHTGREKADVGAERARGATRLDDWCDVRWILTTQDDETGVTERYFRATGRDVETEEARITMDPITRILTLGEGARERNPAAASGPRKPPAANLASDILEYLAEVPASSQRAIRIGVGGRGQAVTDMLRALLSQSLIVELPGRNGGSAYSLRTER